MSTRGSDTRKTRSRVASDGKRMNSGTSSKEPVREPVLIQSRTLLMFENQLQSGTSSNQFRSGTSSRTSLPDENQFQSVPIET